MHRVICYVFSAACLSFPAVAARCRPACKLAGVVAVGLIHHQQIGWVTWETSQVIHLVSLSDRTDSLQKNQDLEFERNRERFEFLKVWARAWLHHLVFHVVGLKEVCRRPGKAVFPVFFLLFNPSGVPRPFAICGLFPLAQESFTR